MNILLVEDHDILRHAILFNGVEIFGLSRITAYGSFTDLFANDRDLRRFHLALIDPGVPPVRSGVREERLKYTSELFSRLDQACAVFVFTGDFDRREADEMIAMGADKYISKNGLGLYDMHRILTGSSQRIHDPCNAKVPCETIYPGLSPSEKLGYVVDQGIYDAADVCRAHRIDLESVHKYIMRARVRLRKSKKAY